MANPLKATGLVSLWTLLSRILGLVRDVVFARFFGAGAGMDVFVVAFQIPNFLRRLFAEGAFAQAFVPVLGEYHARDDHDNTKELVSKVTGTLGAILLMVCAVAVVAAPVLIWLFASGFADTPEKYDLATDMLRITIWYLFFISLTALAGGVLNTVGRFGAPAFTPVLLNIALIGAVFFLVTRFERPMMGLAWGVFLAGASQLLFQIPFLKSVSLMPRPTWAWRDSGVQKIVALMLPAIFGASVAQINLIVDRKIASYLQEGSISWLYYSDRLLEFPLGVFTIALATVVLPFLSRQHSIKNNQLFSDTLDWAQRLVVLITVPAAVGLFILAGPLLATVFQYNAFSGSDTRMAVYSLGAYAIGLVGFSFVKVLVPGYFARQDTRTPVRIGVIALVFNIVANLAIVIPMMRSGFTAPHMGLALATSMSAWLNAGLLWRGLKNDGVLRPLPGWGLLALRVGLASIVMTAVLIYFRQDTVQWISWPWQTRVTRLTTLILGGAAVYFATLFLCGVRFAQLQYPKMPLPAKQGKDSQSEL